jgi:hypothetical protein
MEADELVIDEVVDTFEPYVFVLEMIGQSESNRFVFNQRFAQWLTSDNCDQHTLNELANGVSTDCLQGMFRELDIAVSRYIHYPGLQRAAHELAIGKQGKRLLGKKHSLTKLRSFMSLFEYADDLRADIRESLDVDLCPDCQEYEYNEKSLSVWGEDYVCRDCCKSCYTFSSFYDVFIHDDDVRDALDENGNNVTIHHEAYQFAYSPYQGMFVHLNHPDHPQNRPREPELIGSYHSSKGNFYLQHDEWTKANNRWFGVELEVMHQDGEVNKAAKAIHEIVNHNGDEPLLGKRMFFERDGSLGSAGFEMITQPMSLPAQRKTWEFLKDKSSIHLLRSHKTTNCGLHVHVSRTGLTKLQIAKLVTFINDPLHEDFIRAIARRYQNGFCNIKPKKIGTAAQSNDRYEAVNLTPRATIEFRLFKGTLKYESLIAAIEFTHALIEFCKPTQTSITDLTTDAFMRFMEEKIPHETEFVRPYIKNNLESE